MPLERPNPSTILLVDDTPENLKMLNAYLKEAGFRVAIAESGVEALQLADYAPPDLILLDVMMPDMDGFETCRRLKQNEVTKEIPVLFLTALTETIDKVRGFEVGGVDYLTKPAQPEEVLARITVHLNLRKFQHQLQEQNTLLEEQRERFQILSEAAFEGILFHEDGWILEVNQTMEQMFGYPRAEVLGRNVLEFVTLISHPIVNEHLRTKDDRPYEAEGIRNDGTIFPVEVQARTMPYHGRDVRVAILRDLTWRKQMETEKAQLERENLALRATLQDRYKFGAIIGKSQAMQQVYQSIVNAAASDASVVIEGESGTGKELVARTIHQQSARCNHAFVPVNCGAVPETLFEREFFGHRKGAFTGAERDQPGYFDRAQGGTLFLDEVSELSQAMQVKLLRVLQDGEYRPLGDTHSKRADVRMIAATNQNLRELLHKRVMREDFFYRIRVMVINLPPLRDRKDDLLLLIEFFLNQYTQGQEQPVISGKTLEALSLYDWPCNVRELQNELQRYLAEQRLEFLGNMRTERALEEDAVTFKIEPGSLDFRELLEAFEKRVLAQKLVQNQGHTGKTAAMLGIPLRTLQRKIKDYGL